MPELTITPGEFKATNVLTKVLRSVLGLRAGSAVVLLFDGRTHSLWQPACQAAFELGLDFVALHHPVHLQRRYRPAHGGLHRALLDKAEGLVALLTDAASSTTFRRAIVEMARSANCKVCDMPGADLPLLAATCETPFDAPADAAERLGAALAGAQRIEVVTQDQQGQEHRLTVSLAGCPRADQRSARPGEVITFPFGEVRVAVGAAEGAIAINVSTPAGALSGCELVVQFRGGRPVRAAATGSAEPAVGQLLRSGAEGAEGDAGSTWRLTELGIGCHAGLRRCTGRPSIDAKMAGVVRIALTPADAPGKTADPDAQVDLITAPGAVLVDGQLLALPAPKPV